MHMLLLTYAVLFFYSVFNGPERDGGGLALLEPRSLVSGKEIPPRSRALVAERKMSPKKGL